MSFQNLGITVKTTMPVKDKIYSFFCLPSSHIWFTQAASTKKFTCISQ